MAKAGIQKHTHKLKRLKFKSGNATFFCVLPDCTFKINPPLALGKRNICWRCGEEHILNEYSLRLAKPHCESCHHPKGSTKEQVNQTVATDGSLNKSQANNVSLSDRLSGLIKAANDAESEDI